MEKKENKDMVYYRVDENTEMRADVVETFNNILRYYIDSYYKLYMIGSWSKKDVNDSIAGKKNFI